MRGSEKPSSIAFNGCRWSRFLIVFFCSFIKFLFFFLLILSLSLNQSVSFCWPKSLQPISHFQLPMADLKFSFAETFLCSAFAACFAEVFTIYWCKFIMCSFYFFFFCLIILMIFLLIAGLLDKCWLFCIQLDVISAFLCFYLKLIAFFYAWILQLLNLLMVFHFISFRFVLSLALAPCLRVMLRFFNES